MKKGFVILLVCSLVLQSGCGGAEGEAPGAAGGGASASAAREEAPLLAEVLGVPEHYAYENAYVPPDIDSFPDPVGASVVFTVDARNGAVIDRGVGY